MNIETLKYRREYCCDRCGLIWFADTTISNETICPECGNSNKEGIIFACDSMAFIYSIDSLKNELKEKGKEIHYEKGHPYFSRNSEQSK